MMWLLLVHHGTIHKKMSFVSTDHCICLHFRYNLEPTINAIAAIVSDTNSSAIANCDDGGYACLNIRLRCGSAAWDSYRPIRAVLSLQLRSA